METITKDEALSWFLGEEIEDTDEATETDGNSAVIPETDEWYQTAFERVMASLPVNSDVTTDEVYDALRDVARMFEIDRQKNLLTFEAAIEFQDFFEQEKWKKLNFKSQNQFFSDPEMPLRKASGSRYKVVGAFLRDFPLNEFGFLRDFRDRFNMGFDVITNDDGSIDFEKSVEQNSILSPDGRIKTEDGMLRFERVYQVAQLFKNGGVDTSDALELLYHGATDKDDDSFKRRLNEFGANKPIVDDILREAGMSSGIFYIANANDDDASENLDEFSKELAEGYRSIVAEANKIEKDNPNTGKILGSKSVNFLQLPDGRIVMRVTVKDL
jgi:hypothetical protein